MSTLAAELNLSRAAVSYALSGDWEERRRISEATRQMVLEKAGELGYRRNRIATSLRTQKTRAIGIVLVGLGTESHILFRGIESVLGEDFTLLFGASHYDVARERRVLDSFDEYRVEGILLLGTGSRENLPTLRALVAKGLPLVQIDRYFSELQTSVVEADNEGLGAMLTEHLIGLGHRRIFYIRSPHDHSGNLARATGYEKQMRRHRLKPECFPPSPVDHTDPDSYAGYYAEQMRRILAIHPPPFGVIGNSTAVIPSALAVVEEAGYRCPEDVAFCAAGLKVEVPYPHLMRFRFSVAQWSTEEMGRKAAQLLLTQIEDRRASRAMTPQHLVVRGRMVPGQSTARVVD
ncbi:MAG TPA: LacI family DNA-binding transcriptional regulator [Chthoniobacteraceae bacterium]|nr:LacI family DNA-binding transcriptional regulator [Chthoniobacteraceae bacterium]